MITWTFVLAASLGLLINPWPLTSTNSRLRPRVTASENPFFRDDDVVELTLYLPLAAVQKDWGTTPATHAAVVAYRTSPTTSSRLAVQVKVRGHRRNDPAVCGFPPLLVKFPPPTGAGTLFGPVQELKLVTHCLSDTYTLREYLVYKLYNALTDLSFRARLCRITYQDTRSKGRSMVHYGFFLEDAKSLALRHQAALAPKTFAVGMSQAEPQAMATLAVFQYLIGNTDWSVPYRHNIRLLTRSQDAGPLPVAYDFDYAGLVMPPYAVPPPQLGLQSVRQRLFRGPDFSTQTYAQVRDLFNARRAAMYTVYQACPYLSQEEKTFAISYLNSFYKTLNDPKDFERSIARAGLRNGKKYTHIRGFD